MREFKVGDRVIKTASGVVGVVESICENGLPVLADDTIKDAGWPTGLVHASDHINNPAQPITGGRVGYYLVRVNHPQREGQPAYTAECEDIAEALELNPDEFNIFKEIWRSANARKGNGKPDHKALYGAEKCVHYSGRILRRLQREAQK